MSYSFKFALPLSLLALVTLACGVTINIPVQKIATGPTQTDELRVPAPNVQVADLTLAFGAGELNLQPGANGNLLSGTAVYNVPDFKPKISVSADRISVETGNLKIQGLPSFDNNVKNNWDLELGDMPMKLAINAGAYKGDFDLGGLSLETLEISDGAADVQVQFSQPNKVEMDSLRYTTGASNVELRDLANANFASMIFRSGAGNYKLDFSGELQRDAVVTLESGISQVVLVIPQGVSANVYFKGGLTGVKTPSGWSHSGDAYTQAGSGPVLTINIDMGAGNLELRSE